MLSAQELVSGVTKLTIGLHIKATLFTRLACQMCVQSCSEDVACFSRLLTVCPSVHFSAGYILALGPLVFVSVFDVWLAKFTTKQAYIVNLVSVGVVAFGCTGITNNNAFLSTSYQLGPGRCCFLKLFLRITHTNNSVLHFPGSFLSDKPAMT